MSRRPTPAEDFGPPPTSAPTPAAKSEQDTPAPRPTPAASIRGRGVGLTAKAVSRFFSKTKRNGACLEWNRPNALHGYGVFYLGGVYKLAHRMAVEMSEGPIRAGAEVNHLCRNRACVDVNHLEVLSPETHYRVDRAARVAGARRGAANQSLADKIRGGHAVPRAARIRGAANQPVKAKRAGGYVRKVHLELPRGVGRDSRGPGYHARIHIPGKGRVYLGYFHDLKKASDAYETALSQLNA